MKSVSIDKSNGVISADHRSGEKIEVSFKSKPISESDEKEIHEVHFVPLQEVESKPRYKESAATIASSEGAAKKLENEVLKDLRESARADQEPVKLDTYNAPPASMNNVVSAPEKQPEPEVH